MWGHDVSPQSIEDDDWLYEPDKIDSTGCIFTGRGFTTIGFLFLLALGLIGLLCVT
jgi:beta-glucan synthesis-associated protein KRE6